MRLLYHTSRSLDVICWISFLDFWSQFPLYLCFCFFHSRLFSSASVLYTVSFRRVHTYSLYVCKRARISLIIFRAFVFFTPPSSIIVHQAFVITPFHNGRVYFMNNTTSCASAWITSSSLLPSPRSALSNAPFHSALSASRVLFTRPS